MSNQRTQLPPARPRISGISGLNERRIPVDGTVLPQSLIAWAAAGDNRSAALAPVIYGLPAGNSGGAPDTSGSGRTLIADNQTQRDTSSARRRWRLARKPAGSQPATTHAGPTALRHALNGQGDTDSASQPDTSTTPDQTLLQPSDLWALSHLLMVLKYPDSPLGVVTPHERLTQRVELFFRPGPIIRRMGYSLHGERYARLENSLARLSKLMVVEETLNTTTGDWVAESSGTEPLLQHLDTGLCRIENGRDTSDDQPTGRRNSEWRIAPGRPLIQMLNAAPADLVMIPQAFWRAAGRSRPLQCLALDIARHGYDNRSRIYPSRFDTLIEKTRMLDDDAHSHEFRQGELGLAAADTGSSRQRRDFRSASRHAHQSLRQGVRTLDRALARFSNRLGLADIRVQPGNQDDLSPRQRQDGQRSRNDRVAFTRWTAPIESALGRLTGGQQASLRPTVLRCNAVLHTARLDDDSTQPRQLGDNAGRLIEMLQNAGRFYRRLTRLTLQRTTDLFAVSRGYAPAAFTPASQPPLTL